MDGKVRERIMIAAYRWLTLGKGGKIFSKLYTQVPLSILIFLSIYKEHQTYEISALIFEKTDSSERGSQFVEIFERLEIPKNFVKKLLNNLLNRSCSAKENFLNAKERTSGSAVFLNLISRKLIN